MAKCTFPRKLIFYGLHLQEYMFGRNHTFPKLILQKLYTLVRNFVTDRIYNTKIYNGACLFSKIK